MSPEPSEDGALPLYRTDDLARFMSRLEGLREPAAPGPDWVDIATAAHRTKTVTERTLDLILKHRLPLRCRGRDAASFRDFLVEPVTLREAAILPADGAVHPARAARLLGLTNNTVLALLQRGHLDNVRVTRPSPLRPVTYVEPCSMDIFFDYFVSLSKFMASRGLDRRHLEFWKQFLQHLALDLGPNTEPIYRREDVELL